MMTSETSNLREQFRAAVEAGEAERFEECLSALPPADAAEALEELDGERKATVLQRLRPATLVPALPYLPAEEIEEILGHLSPHDLQEALNSYPDDDLTDLLQKLAPDTRRSYFSLLRGRKREAAHRLLEYPETTAGGRMTTAFATVSEDMTIREAIETLASQREETEVLSRIYVVDDQNRILGKVRLRDLTFNRRSLLVGDVMQPEPLALLATADQEEAAQLVAKHDLVTLPIINDNNQLVGVITHDDAMEILEEESTEDFEKQSGIAGPSAERDYLDTPVLSHFRRRFIWVLGLAFLAITSGFVIHHFEGVLNSAFILAIYMPMVVAAGGNTGAQAATTVIRAMALGEFGPEQFMRAVWKEMRIGFGLGSILGFCIALQIILFFPGGASMLPPGMAMSQVALTVAFSLAAQVTASTILGAALPILAKALKQDPAVVASPAITTIVDVTGLVIYFTLARLLLGL